MFKSIRYLRFAGNRFIYKLIDSEFEQEISFISGFSVIDSCTYALSIAQEYKKRRLNVAANLALYFKYVIETYNHTFAELKRYDYRYNSDSAKTFYENYLTDIEKYLNLI